MLRWWALRILGSQALQVWLHYINAGLALVHDNPRNSVVVLHEAACPKSASSAGEIYTDAGAGTRADADAGSVPAAADSGENGCAPTVILAKAGTQNRVGEKHLPHNQRVATVVRVLKTAVKSDPLKSNLHSTGSSGKCCLS